MALAEPWQTWRHVHLCGLLTACAEATREIDAAAAAVIMARVTRQWIRGDVRTTPEREPASGYPASRPRQLLIIIPDSLSIEEDLAPDDPKEFCGQLAWSGPDMSTWNFYYSARPHRHYHFADGGTVPNPAPDPDLINVGVEAGNLDAAWLLPRVRERMGAAAYDASVAAWEARFVATHPTQPDHW